jgi:hypothetical protein
MSLAFWGQTVLDAYHPDNERGRISIGKSRKGGDNQPMSLALTDRWAYLVQKLIETLLEAPGTATEKRALVTILDGLNNAVQHAVEEQERAYLLRKHNVSPISPHVD